MSALGRYFSQRHQRLVPAYLAAIILGIVGMHALMQHCPTPTHSMTASTGIAEMSHHADQALVMAMPISDAAATFVEVTGQPSGSMGDMLMLCAAMMLSAGVLLMLFSRRPDRPIALPLPRPITWCPLLTCVGTGPPPALAFTVIRC